MKSEIKTKKNFYYEYARTVEWTRLHRFYPLRNNFVEKVSQNTGVLTDCGSCIRLATL